MKTDRSATRALIRNVPASYAPTYEKRGTAILQSLAEQQHAAYRSALERAGLRVEVVAASELHYDCVFVEDAAVVWQDTALIGRSTGDRDGEQAPVADVLRKTHTLHAMPPAALLEGGDVLHVEDVTYVGSSSRTNTEGIAALTKFLGDFGRKVIAVPVTRALHLKTATTYLGGGTIVAASGLIDPDQLHVPNIFWTAPGEACAANCIRVRKHLFMPARCPLMEARLREFSDGQGLTLEVIDISEFEKGEGSLTCLSVIW